MSKSQTFNENTTPQLRMLVNNFNSTVRVQSVIQNVPHEQKTREVSIVGKIGTRDFISCEGVKYVLTIN